MLTTRGKRALIALFLGSVVNVSTASGAQTERVVDGGFETPPGTPWAYTFGAQPCTPTVDPCGAFPAASGLFYAATTTFVSIPQGQTVGVGTITQNLTVPEAPATLTFKLRDIEDLGSLDPELKIFYGLQELREITDLSGTTFETITIPIPGSLIGPGLSPLTFDATCTNDGVGGNQNCDRFDIDDVSILSGVPDPPPAPPADTTAPETTITKAPGKLTVKSKKKKAKASVSFESNEAGAGFDCQLDGKGYAPCTSPAALSLKRGNHTFLVRAVDAVGNRDGSPASVAIKVVVKKKKQT